MTRLTANQRRVLDALQQADGPLGAYAILKTAGFRGATQVYRALQKLMKLGLVKKLESLNAFVAASGECESDPTAFAICDQCGHIHELAKSAEIKQLHEQLARMNFQVGRTVVEFHGACAFCSGKPLETSQQYTPTQSKQA